MSQAGGENADPVRQHYLALLSARAQTQSGTVKRVLEAKLALAQAQFHTRPEPAHRPTSAATTPEAAPERAAEPTRESLRDLVRALAPAGQAQGAVAGDTPANRTELKSVRQFRNTWSKLSADKQVAQALVQAPKNAGPINSHMLMLRSLALMREISPDYLNRFMTYADTLLCLEHHEQAKYALPTKSSNTEAGKKPRATRTRAK